MKKQLVFLSTMLLFFGVLGIANATLWDRGSGLIYDDVLNITWLQNANYAASEVNETRAQEIIDAVGSIDDHILTLADFHDYDSSGGSYNGKMSWYGSLAWADQLVYGGYDDWRLPKGGNQIGGGELGHMYYENLPLYSSLIYNLVEDYYWSSDEYYPYPPDTDTPYAFMFYFYTPSNVHERIFTFKDNVVWAWAVRDGDVIPHTHCVSSSAELQDALNVAATNSTPDIIRIRSSVAPYDGNPVYSSTEPYGLTLEGGYTDELCTVRVVDYTNTVLDGDNTGRALTLDCSGVAAELVVDGLTIRNGNANIEGGGLYAISNGNITLNNNRINNNNAFHGGGIYFVSFSGSITLINNIINNNNANGNNGGVYINSNSGTVTLIRNNISHNSAQSGAGGVNIYSPYGTLTLTNNTISYNSAQSGAGGMNYDSTSGSLTFTNNIIMNNQTSGAGGGVYINSSISGTYTLINNIISNNFTNSAPWSTNNAGGIFFYSPSATLNLYSNTINNNNAIGSGGGVWLGVHYDTAVLNIFNNIIWNNSAVIEGSDLYINNDNDGNNISSTVLLYNNDFDLSNGFFIKIDDSSVVYSNNLNNEDPKFDVDGYHLTKGSPCIDKGTEENAPDTDIDGDFRPQGAGYDIGADEYVVYDSDGDGIPDDVDACPSSDLSGTVIIDGWDTGVENVLLEDGCTISDLISECADEADNHGEFVSAVSHTTNALKKNGVISGKDKGRIQKGVAKAAIP